MVKASPKVLAEIYRQHHIPLPRITLQALLQRGPRATPAVVAKVQGNAAALEQWKQDKASAIVHSAQLLHREVPIRLARRIVDLENLPGGLPDAPSIVQLRECLISSFDQMMSFPLPKDLDEERAYMEMQRRIRDEHATMHSSLADALRELKTEPQGLGAILDGFYNSRIGIRMLVDQHVAAQNPVAGYTGILADQCSPVQIAHDVIDKVRPLWQENLQGRALPEFHISGQVDATYRYIPQHISLVLSEAIKNAVLNSLNAASASSSAPPPVEILVAGGSHGVCVKVSDRGGGMTRDQANELFAYVQPSHATSAGHSSSTSAYDPVSAALERRASGIDFQQSFGLRIASLYAQYFGGALSLMPMEGHGVDTYIYMNCLTEDSQLKMMMQIGMDDDDDDGDGSLHNVPFALLDVDAVAQYNSSSWSCSSLPGLVQETSSTCGAQPIQEETASSYVWSSNSSITSSFPREIALRVLSSSHYRVHTIRIVFQTAKRPSRLEIYGAKATSSSSRSGRGSPATLDPLSQYFSSLLEPLCPSISWPPETALTWPLRPTQVQIPIAHSTESTAFFKLVVHQPHPHPDNPKGDVVIQQLELFGTFQLPGRFVPLLPQVSDPQDDDVEMQPIEAESDDMRDFLKAAGLSEELIRELLLSTTTNTTVSESHQSATPQSNEVYQAPTQPTGLLQSEQHQQQQTQYVLDSVFDLAMRDFVHRRAQQDELFASLATPRFNSSSTESSITTTTIGSQLPRIRCDGARSHHHHYEAIAIHTFGSFFTQCLLHEDTEVRVMSLQVAERLSPLLPEAGMSLELVYEGLLAIVVLALEEPESSHDASSVSLSVFHAALHLIQTIFQERDHGFRLVTALPRGKLNTGLETILRIVLRLPHCWSLGATTTINRELLKTVRLLLRQESTRSSFIRAVCLRRSHDHNQQTENDRDEPTHSVTTLNRLRLMRWLLQRHRDMLSSDDTASIQHMCEHLREKGRTGHGKAITLAQQCLQLLLQQASRSAKPTVKDLDAQLVAMKRHLQQHDKEHRENETTVDAHVPLFDSFPLAAHERSALVGRLTEYFQLHKRPTALYRHEFTVSSLQDHVHDGGVFQKGNIVFKGYVEERTAPHVPFTQEIQRNTKPFEFHAPQSQGNGRDRITEAAQVTVETAFATFNGTVEPRRDCHTTAVRSTFSSSSAVAPSRHIVPDVPDVIVAIPRRPSHNGSTKLSRVVPVSDVDSSADSQPVGVDTSVAAPVPPPASKERRVSTAAPTAVQAGSGRFADPIPSESPTKTSTTTPKTAPVGKSRGTTTTTTSQGDSNGCVLQ